MRRLCFVIAVSLGLAVGAAAQDAVVALLKQLSEAPGPSGFEEPVARIMAAQMGPLATAPVGHDGLGSVIAQQGSAGPRIMIDAHTDELGGMIRNIRPDGFMTMQMLGGWLDQALPGQRWEIIGSKGPVPAVTTIWDAHITSGAERGRVIPRNNVYLDVGAHSAADVAALGIGKGDPVAPWSPFEVLNGTRYVGKAWDDRAGCAVMVEVMKRLQHAPHANRLFYAATTQEEIGERGATTAAEVIQPDLGISIEAGIPRDVPGTDPEAAQERLGGGPALFLYDPSELPNRKLVAFVEQVAKELNIPLQLDEVQGYGDDSSVIQRSNGGVPTVNLAIPTRYTHVHNGMIDRADFDRTVDLIAALLQKLDAATVEQIRSF